MRNDKPIEFLFESVLRKNKQYFIANKTLENIRFGYIENGLVFPSRQTSFNDLLNKYGMKVVKIDDEISVIKKW